MVHSHCPTLRPSMIQIPIKCVQHPMEICIGLCFWAPPHYSIWAISSESVSRLYTIPPMSAFFVTLKNGFSAFLLCCLRVTSTRSKVPLTKTVTGDIDVTCKQTLNSTHLVDRRIRTTLSPSFSNMAQCPCSDLSFRLFLRLVLRLMR